MNSDISSARRKPAGPFDALATAVLAADGTIIGWSPAAEDLFGYSSLEALGRPVADLLGDGLKVPSPDSAEVVSTTFSALCRDRHAVPVALAFQPLGHGKRGVAWLLSAMSEASLDRWASDRAMLKGLSEQVPIEIFIYDTQARVKWVNAAAVKRTGWTLEDWRGRFVSDVVPQGEIISAQAGTVHVEEIIRRVLVTGEPCIDVQFRGPTRFDPDHNVVWSSSYFRMQDVDGRPLGVCETSVEVTIRYVMRQRLALLSRAGGRIGQALDLGRTAYDLADVVVPEFADAARVDLLDSVLQGEEPGRTSNLRRMAEREIGRRPSPPHPVEYTQDSPQLRCLAEGHPVVGGKVLAVPLLARGNALGLATFERFPPRDPFEEEEVDLAQELVSRTAICVDNGRRYRRERAAALTLQRDLLPGDLPETTAVGVAHRYLPAAGPIGVGGDWYDVIPLSGARVGLVIGDVAGRGMHAAATMGRMRTAVAALAVLDLAPDELLARLDDLVAQPFDAKIDQAVCTTCLYAVYDPVTRHLVMARAGHLPPVVVTPDGHVETLELPAGPPLGVGGLPFDSAEFDLAEGSLLAFFTDGLVESRRQTIDIGLRKLSDALSGSVGVLEETCDAVVTAALPSSAEDDATLLLVRVHALNEDQVASWTFAADPSEVSRCRDLAVQKVETWGYDEAVFVIELVVSELVTNAIRYGGAPMRLRLIRDRSLICEVSDSGHTSPHLRRAGHEDEGGRGLFLVAQLTERWGTRYTQSGKTIWAEVIASG